MKNSERKNRFLTVTVSCALHVTLILCLSRLSEEEPERLTIDLVIIDQEPSRAPERRLPRKLVLDITKPLRTTRREEEPADGGGFDSEGAASIRPSEWERSRSFEHRAELAPLIEKVAAKVDSNLIYREELVAAGRQGTVAIALVLKGNGQLVKMQPAPSTLDLELTGWALTVVQKSLTRPLVSEGDAGEIQAMLEINFRITHPSDHSASRETVIIGNTIIIDREGKAPARYDLTVQSFDDNIFTRIFEQRPENENRAEWDLIHRKREAVRACENRRASGACLIAGKIALSFGEAREAKAWLTVACEGGIAEACSLLP